MLPVIEAKYTARARATSWGTSTKGNEQIAVTFEVIEGEHAGSAISYIRAFTDNTTEWIVKSLRACGWASDDLMDLYNLDEEGCDRMLPDTVQIVCKPKQPQEPGGKVYLEVAFVNKPGAGQFEFKQGMEAQDVRSFAARMKSTVASLSPATKKAPANGAKSPF